jgi:cell division protein FtsB
MSDETNEEPFPDPADDSLEELPEELPEESPEESPGKAPTQPAFSQTARRIAWDPRTRVAVVSLALVAMMFLFVFPTRSYLAQKHQIGEAAHAVKVLEAQNEVLARQASRLKTKSEIERLAREQFNMVLPGEQAYNVVETPSGSTDTSTTTVP